jgi:Tn3 transposase DDE domain
MLSLQITLTGRCSRRIGAICCKWPCLFAWARFIRSHRCATYLCGEGVIADNDSEEQEKLIKYNGLVANAVIFQNVADVSRILRELLAEGCPVKREDVAALGPYLTRHIKRFADYFIDLSVVPQPLLETDLKLAL